MQEDTETHKLHVNIKFTKEIEIESSLPFLDVNIKVIDNKFIFNTYRKPTFTGLFLNYFANAPLKFKKSLVNCLIHRIFSITSSWSYFHLDTVSLLGYLNSNGYPSNFFYKVLNRFLMHKFCYNPVNVNKFDVCNLIILPYYKKASDHFGKSIVKFFKSKNVIVNIVFKSVKLGSCFSLKDKTPFLLKSNVVYEFQCPVAQDRYIGKTTRHLITRIKEHLSANSMLYDHFLICNCKSNLINVCKQFHILSTGSYNYDVKIKESFLILKNRPSLNVHVNQGSEFTIKIFS